MSTEVVRFEMHDEHVAVITIDRPEARNAISPEVTAALEAAVDRVEEDEGLRVAVLTATPPVFCAGADLKAIRDGRRMQLSTDRGGFAGLVRRKRRKPMIAAVDGPALAGGTEIVLSCDLVVASEAARFGLPEVKRGLVAAAGGLFRLPRKLPVNLAMEHVLTGEPIAVETAVRFGLVNRVAAPGAALATALELAAAIAANAPIAVRESRRVMLESGPRDEIAWELSRQAAAVAVASEDVQEGIAAFLEKRAPVWRGV
ncbi:MAG: crotonase/enoyl-CoA hydratase family protein [Actinobacteria bacterium]|nr:crotonase/enoyl-CoA hydratase family protein [Actinomycetota bacterium]